MTDEREKKAFPKGQAYRARYPEIAKGHTEIPRKEDGAPNFEILKIADLLQRELGSQKAFIEVIPTGSMMSGYSTSESAPRDRQSDMDFIVLYDSSLEERAEDTLRAKLVKIFRGEDALYRREHPSSPAWEHSFMFDLNKDTLRANFANAATDREEHGRLAFLIAALAGRSAGDRLDEYRLFIGEQLKGLSEGARVTFIETAARLRLVMDEGSYDETREPPVPKRTSRVLTEVTPEEVDNTIGGINFARASLWLERLVKVYGLDT